MKALLIAEKPSLMRTIEGVYNKHKSEIPYDVTFLSQHGHLLTLKLPNELDEESSSWDWESLPFNPEDHGGFQYKLAKGADESYKEISKALKSGKYDFVINAGDPDQEGELLIRIVLESLGNTLPVKRYWSNDLTEGRVLETLKNLRDDDNDPMLVNLYKAALGRQHSDYRYGMNISRAATLKMGARVACGRVKTPILSIVCKREKEIANFKPSTSYGVIADYTDGFTGQLYEGKVEEESKEDSEESKDKDPSAGMVWFETEKEAEEYISGLSSPATVTLYKTKREETYAPKLFKLATAQISAGKAVGFDPAKTLSVIQSLYEKGYLSYPRTDCEYLSSGEDLSALLKSAYSVPFLQPFIDSIDPSVIGKVRATKKWVNDKKLSESGHSAIIPTTKAPNFDELTGEQKAIYTMVCRQFVAIFLPPLIQDKTLLLTDISGHTFKSTGKTLVDAGYTKIFGTKFSDVEIPVYSEGDSIGVDDFELAKKTTTCPKRYTQADLISVCEAPHKHLEDKRLKELGKRLKIGTPATRSSIIKELLNRDKYLQEAKEKKTQYIVPSEYGMTIYDNLKDLDICKVDMTGHWEEQLELIRKGELTLADFEESIIASVSAMIDNIKENTDMTKIVRKKSEIICQCPECGGDVIAGDKNFFCSKWKEGCKFGAKRHIHDSVIKNDEFKLLAEGMTIKKTIKKGTLTWEQELKYDFDKHWIAFVKAAESETQYSCPNCGEKLTDDGRAIKCTCGFKLWKTAGEKPLTDEQIEKFFTEGETGFISGLRSKKGKLFSANIVLADDKMGSKFVFPDKN